MDTNKEQLVSQLARVSEVSKKVVLSVLASLVRTVQNSLKNDGNVRIDGLEAFLVAQRKARTEVNPRTKDEIMIPVTKVPRFRAAKVLKDTVKPQEKPKEKKGSKKTK